MTVFTFDDTIPAANNNPSSDQPLMLINNQSDAGIWDIDHVGFNQSNGGTHSQITFSSNNVPTIPTTQPIAFTNNVSGVPQLFFYPVGNASVTSNQYVSASSGSTYLLGGIIMKWGPISNGAITFTSAFPNNIFSLQVSSFNGSGNYSGVTTSGFTASSFTAGANYYMAIGN